MLRMLGRDLHSNYEHWSGEAGSADRPQARRLTRGGRTGS
jgi:hypothetical protein